MKRLLFFATALSLLASCAQNDSDSKKEEREKVNSSSSSSSSYSSSSSSSYTTTSDVTSTEYYKEAVDKYYRTYMGFPPKDENKLPDYATDTTLDMHPGDY